LCPQSSAAYVKQPEFHLDAAINIKELMSDKNNYNFNVDTDFSASDAGLKSTGAGKRRRKKQTGIEDHIWLVAFKNWWTF
jgi:hypothetical protein